MPTETIITVAGVLAAFAFFMSVVLYVDTTSKEK
jgi:uncharacterized membrane protein